MFHNYDYIVGSTNCIWEEQCDSRKKNQVGQFCQMSGIYFYAVPSFFIVLHNFANLTTSLPPLNCFKTAWILSASCSIFVFYTFIDFRIDQEYQQMSHSLNKLYLYSYLLHWKSIEANYSCQCSVDRCR